MPLVSYDENNVATVEKQYALYQLPKEAEQRPQEFLSSPVVPWYLFQSEAFKAKSLKYQGDEPKSTRDRRKTGSNSGCWVQSEDIEQLPIYTAMAESLNIEIPCRNRAKVTTADWSIFLMMMFAFTKRDLPISWKAAKQQWDELYEEGVSSRAFSNSRWSAMRRYLDTIDWIEYRSRAYKIGLVDADGNYQKGSCAKWRASELALEAREQAELHAATCVEKEASDSSVTRICRRVLASNLPQDLYPIFTTKDDGLRILEKAAAKYIGHWEPPDRLAA